MTLHYRIADPADLRDLGDLMNQWIAAGNPKAADWSEAPLRPDGETYWNAGQWVVVTRRHYASTQYGWVFGVQVLDHEATDFDRAQALPRTLVACPEEVQVGWRYDEATGSFSAP